MPYTMDISLALGPSRAGLTDLRAQLVDTAGGNVGSAISTGFTEIGQGFYLWHYTAFPDDHRGGVWFYSNAAPTVPLSFVGINPEEAEYQATMPTRIWTHATRTLTSFGSLVSDVAAAVWAAATRTLSAFGFQVQLDLGQAVPTSNTAQTVGDALNAARAQGFGRWVLLDVGGTPTLRLYAPDGTTIVRSFVLDSLTAPTTRT